MNAVAHAVEALYAPDATPIISLMAEEGARALAGALPLVVDDGADLDARGRAQYGAWLAGRCLGATTMALHHKLCHALGGTFDLPHAATHTVVLPHASPTTSRGAGRGGGAVPGPGRRPGPGAAAVGPRRRARAPRSLRELGMAEADIPRIVEQALASPDATLSSVTADGLTRLLHAAWAGDPPAA